jgi:hypothetical protein
LSAFYDVSDHISDSRRALCWYINTNLDTFGAEAYCELCGKRSQEESDAALFVLGKDGDKSMPVEDDE